MSLLKRLKRLWALSGEPDAYTVSQWQPGILPKSVTYTTTAPATIVELDTPISDIPDDETDTSEQPHTS